MKTLWEEFPTPWTLITEGAPEQGHGTYTVIAANDKTVIYSGTFTGDGDDEFNVTYTQLAELLAAVNSYKRP